LQPLFPFAMQVPYPCSQCGGSSSGSNFVTRYSKSLPDVISPGSFVQVLKQANLQYESIIKSPHRRRSGNVSRSRHRVKSEGFQ
jgi:hypothetical protein